MPSLPNFISPAYLARSPNVAADRLINLYPELVEATRGKNVAAFYGTPGLTRRFTLPGSGAIRALYTESMSNRVFAVRGQTLYELFAGGTYLDRGGLTTSAGNVCMADNGSELALVDGSGGYVLTLATNAYGPIADPDFPAATQIRFLDGYFLFNIPNTGRFGITELYDATAVDSLDFATAEGAPDNIVAILIDHREVWLFGTRSIEVWFNSGDPDFPFDRIQGAFIEYGCGAPFSTAGLDNTVYWLGSDQRGQRMVFRARGYQPERISTHAIEFAIAGYSSSSVANATAYTYQQEGHSFYVLNFDEATWCYDVATGLWHERARLLDDGSLGRHRAQCYTAGLGMNLVGDYENGKIYELDLNRYTDDGEPIPRIRVAPHITQDLDLLFHHLFQLDLESGIGIDAISTFTEAGFEEDGFDPGFQTETEEVISSATAGINPQIMLQWSDDGGHTWSGERWTSAGPIGHYRYRARWRRLGRSRYRVYRIKMTDPVKAVWINAKVEVTAGVS